MNKLSKFEIDPIIMRWIASFLSDRRQRVKIGNVLSGWSTLVGGMPQGTWLGIYFFLVYINDLQSDANLVKFVDDITVIEEIEKSGSSHMQSIVDQIVKWSN